MARLLTEEFVNPHMVDLPGNGFISDLERFYLQKRFYHGLICHFPSDDGKCKKRKDKEGHQKDRQILITQDFVADGKEVKAGKGDENKEGKR